MFIHEAVQVAQEIDGYIVRRRDARRIRIKPMDGTMCCAVYIKNQDPQPRWQPKAEDLLADDWTVTKEGWT